MPLRHDTHDFLPRSLVEGMRHSITEHPKKGNISLRRILDNAHSPVPGLWPLFGTENKVNPEIPTNYVFFLLIFMHSVVARNNDILKRLVLEAKREYEKDAEHRVHIFMADT